MNTNRQRKMREVGTPANPSAFLRDGARYGAMRITKNGVTRYFVGAPTHAYDPDRGFYMAPLFAPMGAELRKQFRASVEMGQLD